MADSKDKIDAALRTLYEETSDLYLHDSIRECEGWPEPLEFYRAHVSRNLPLLMRGAVRNWPAVSKWNPQYFRTRLGDKKTHVALTANGLADAVATGPDGREYFVLPHYTDMTFAEFLDLLEEKRASYVAYIQTQNSNLSQYEELAFDVPKDVELATRAFAAPPDAVNFWMGDHRAITSMHKDPYENMYCVISGHKDFTLIPPTDLALVPHTIYPVANFTPVGGRLEIVPDDKAKPIPWISIDPVSSDYAHNSRAHIYTVRVSAGDCLYLPSLWHHHVTQSHACIAVNYWYDMDFDIKYCYYKALEQLCAMSS